MINMLIYEPNKAAAERLRSDVRCFFMQIRSDLQLLTHSSFETATAKVSQNPFMFDIALLHYDTYGREMANKIRKKNLLSALIFTGSGGLIPDALKFRPSGYLCAPVEFEALCETLSGVVREQSAYNRSFVVRTKEKIVRIPYGDIDCIESAGRYCSILTASGTGDCSFIAKLDDVSTRLPESIFVRSHKSCLVNIVNASALDKTAHKLIMYSGRLADISKKNYAQIVEVFESFIRFQNAI